MLKTLEPKSKILLFKIPPLPASNAVTNVVNKVNNRIHQENRKDLSIQNCIKKLQRRSNKLFLSEYIFSLERVEGWFDVSSELASSLIDSEVNQTKTSPEIHNTVAKTAPLSQVVSLCDDETVNTSNVDRDTEGKKNVSKSNLESQKNTRNLKVGPKVDQVIETLSSSDDEITTLAIVPKKKTRRRSVQHGVFVNTHPNIVCRDTSRVVFVNNASKANAVTSGGQNRNISVSSEASVSSQPLSADPKNSKNYFDFDESLLKMDQEKTGKTVEELEVLMMMTSYADVFDLNKPVFIKKDNVIKNYVCMYLAIYYLKSKRKSVNSDLLSIAVKLDGIESSIECKYRLSNTEIISIIDGTGECLKFMDDHELSNEVMTLLYKVVMDIQKIYK